GADVEADVVGGRVGQGVSGAVYFQNAPVQGHSVLVHPAADLQQFLIRQAEPFPVELSQRLVPVGVPANVKATLGEVHVPRVCLAKRASAWRGMCRSRTCAGLATRPRVSNPAPY